MLIGGVSVTNTSPPVIVTADPDGVIGAGLGTFAFDTVTQTVYINTDGGTTWRQLALSGGTSAVLPWQTGRYYFTPNASATASIASHGNNSLRVYPVFVPTAQAITRIGTQIVLAGDPGSVVRLGVYADDGTGRPGALVVDAGTIPGDVAATAELTISAPMPGWHWFGGVVQNAAGGQPTVLVSRNVESPADAGTTMPIAGFESYGFRMSGVTGALPAAYVVTAPTASVIRLFVGVGI
jgi:hypothetical protein